MRSSAADRGGIMQRHWDGYSRVIQTGRSRYGENDVLSVPALRKDGTTTSVEFTIAPLPQEAGRLIGTAANHARCEQTL